MTEDPLQVPYREREKSVTMERLEEPGAPQYGTELEPETELFTVHEAEGLDYTK